MLTKIPAKALVGSKNDIYINDRHISMLAETQEGSEAYKSGARTSIALDGKSVHLTLPIAEALTLLFPGH